MITGLTSSRSSTRGNINSFKISSCCMKNKFKTKLPKSQWLKSNTPVLYKPKSMTPRKWCQRKDSSKHKSLTKIGKLKPLIWEFKKWTVSTREKFPSLRNNCQEPKLIISHGLKDKIKILNYGMNKERNLRRKFTNWTFQFKRLRPKINFWNKNIKGKLMIKT